VKICATGWAVLMACGGGDAGPDADTRACGDFLTELPDTSWQTDWPPLVWTGSEYGLGFGRGEDRLDMFGGTVTETGELTAWPDELTGAEPLTIFWKSVAWTGSSFVFIHGDWGANGIITTLDRSGERIAADVIVPGYLGGQAWWNGTRVVVAWFASTGPGVSLAIQQVQATGEVDGPPVPLTNVPGSDYLEAIWNGTSLSVLALDRPRLSVLRLAASGELLAETTIATVLDLGTLAFAASADEDAVAFVDGEELWLGRVRAGSSEVTTSFLEDLPGSEDDYVATALGRTADHYIHFGTVFTAAGDGIQRMLILDADGVAGRPSETVLESSVGAVGHPTMVTTPDRVAVTWTSLRPGATANQFILQRCF
jgi:hypothetical protein